MYSKRADRFRFVAIVLLIASIVFCSIGFYKITVYDGSVYFPQNAYVGGDAYNYIINGTYFAGYCILGGCTLIASLISFGISQYLGIKSNEKENATDEKNQGKKSVSTDYKASDEETAWDETLPPL